MSKMTCVERTKQGDLFCKEGTALVYEIHCAWTRKKLDSITKQGSLLLH